MTAIPDDTSIRLLSDSSPNIAALVPPAIWLRVILGACMCLAPGAASANQCPSPEAPTADAHSHTLIAIRKLNERVVTQSETLSGKRLILDLDEQKVIVLTRYHTAHQRLVVDHLYDDYCNVLVEKNAPNSDALLAEANAAFYSKNDQIIYVTTTKPLIMVPDTGTWRTYTVALTDNHLLASAGKPVVIDSPQSTSTTTEALRSEYHKDSPYVVNASNKYFLQVASAYSCDGPDAAIKEANRLKSLASEFDFAVFEPYQDNRCQYAIMAATWVSRPVAEEALKKYLSLFPSSDAYIWKCPGEGETC